MTCSPDNWVVIKLNSEQYGTIYKILAGWSGGYIQGSSWKLNSGITKVEEDDRSYYFSGSSGSTYRCGKDSYGLKMNNAYVWNQIKEKHGDLVELMDENTDWSSIDWVIGDKK